MTRPTVALTPEQLGRLGSELIGWLTTVTPEGQPQAMPVWFMWEDGTILVYGQRTAARNRNLRHNHLVSFHLNSDETGGAVLTIDGEAVRDEAAPAGKDHPAYLAKYGALLDDSGWTPKYFSEHYPHPFRITPLVVRGF